MNTIANHINNITNTTHSGDFNGMLPQIECKDGFTMSIQRSKFHYSHPKKDLDNALEYTSLEVGYPSEETPELLKFAVDEAIFGFVPVDIINKIIAQHGGIK